MWAVQPLHTFSTFFPADSGSDYNQTVIHITCQSQQEHMKITGKSLFFTSERRPLQHLYPKAANSQSAWRDISPVQLVIQLTVIRLILFAHLQISQVGFLPADFTSHHLPDTSQLSAWRNHLERSSCSFSPFVSPGVCERLIWWHWRVIVS